MNKISIREIDEKHDSRAKRENDEGHYRILCWNEGRSTKMHKSATIDYCPLCGNKFGKEYE